MNNPNWWRNIIACAMMAALIKGVFDYPFFKIWCGLMLIYVMHVLLAEKEMKAGAKTVWGWIKNLGGVFQGIVIFILLRIFVGSLLGLPPIGSYRALAQGGATGVISGFNTPVVLLFELAFATVAGGLTSNYVKGKGRTIVNTIFVVSLLVLILRLTLPDLYEVFPSRKGVDKVLAVKAQELKKDLKTLLETPPPSTNTPPATVAKRTQEALVLRFEGTTPCSTNINFRFKIRVSGPVSIKFQGVADWIPYPNDGSDFKAPVSMQSGETEFVGTDTNRPNVRVQVYEKIVASW